MPWQAGKYLVWDATCTDTVAPSMVNQSRLKAGLAAAKAEKQKRDKYADLPHHLLFVPVAVETFGVFGRAAKAFFAEIGRRLADATRDPRAGTFLRQRLSLDIQRGNAASIRGTSAPTGQAAWW
jgi:hypothetical protein